MIKLELHKMIYSFENIKAVMDIYKDYASIKLCTNEEMYVLIFEKCKYDEKTTIREFENYLIGMENT